MTDLDTAFESPTSDVDRDSDGKHCLAIGSGTAGSRRGSAAPIGDSFGHAA